MYNYKRDVIPKVEIKEDFLNIDWELYKKLLSFRSHSRGKTQDEFRDWLSDWINENIENVTVEEDGYGNLYVQKGIADLYPCVVAHLDINQDDDITDVSIIQTDRFFIGIDNETGKQCGLGCDDKNGVYFGLLMLQTLDVVKCFFPKDEEIGCVGTHQADVTFFEDCSVLVQLDRNSFNNDVSARTNGVEVVSRDFVENSKSILKKYGYSYTTCMYTDVGELVKQGVGCCAMNISSGYYNEHMDDEITSIAHYTNAMNFAYELINTLGYIKRWKHIPKKEEIKPAQKWVKATDVKIPLKADKGEWVDKEFKNADYEDWDYTLPVISKHKKYYHSSEHWDFKAEDELMIEDAISTGCCVICNGRLEEVPCGALVCENCESAYKIPQGTSISEVLIQFDDVNMYK